MPAKLRSIFSHSSSRYFMVGIFAFSLDYLLLLFLYYILNVNLEISTAVGFLAGFVASFTINRQWVFGKEKQKKRLHRQITEYLILVAFNFFFTVWAVSYLNDQGLSPVAGKIIVMALVMCWNYALFRWVIFVRHTGLVE